MDETRKYSVIDDRQIEMHAALLKVYEALDEKGYDPIDQIVGYLLSQDPIYITSYKNARSIICKLDRDEMLQSLLKSYLNK